MMQAMAMNPAMMGMNGSGGMNMMGMNGMNMMGMNGMPFMNPGMVGNNSTGATGNTNKASDAGNVNSNTVSNSNANTNSNSNTDTNNASNSGNNVNSGQQKAQPQVQAQQNAADQTDQDKQQQPMFMMVPMVPPPGNYDQGTQKSQDQVKNENSSDHQQGSSAPISSSTAPVKNVHDSTSIIPNVDNTSGNDSKNNAIPVASAPNPNNVASPPSTSTNDQSQQHSQQFVQSGMNDVNSNNNSNASQPSAPQHRQQPMVNNPMLQEQAGSTTSTGMNDQHPASISIGVANPMQKTEEQFQQTSINPPVEIKATANALDTAAAIVQPSLGQEQPVSHGHGQGLNHGQMQQEPLNQKHQQTHQALNPAAMDATNSGGNSTYNTGTVTTNFTPV